MKFKLYRNHGALNSSPVFDAFSTGVTATGHEIVQDHEDVAVIWSVLWWGRMQPNQEIYQRCVKSNRPVIIIEVGNLKRGETWRISDQHINNLGIFGNTTDIDPDRPRKLGISLSPKVGQPSASHRTHRPTPSARQSRPRGTDNPKPPAAVSWSSR